LFFIFFLSLVISCRPRSHELLEELLRDVAAIAEEFAKELFGHCRNGLAIVHIAGCDHHSQQLARVIDDEVDFEAVKPADARFATSGQSTKDLVGLNPAIVTNGDAGGVHE
jgi:hypothetical protein